MKCHTDRKLETSPGV